MVDANNVGIKHRKYVIYVEGDVMSMVILGLKEENLHGASVTKPACMSGILLLGLISLALNQITAVDRTM